MNDSRDKEELTPCLLYNGIGICIYFNSEDDIDGQGSCLWWDDEPHACTGWVNPDDRCECYETVNYIGLYKEDKD